MRNILIYISPTGSFDNPRPDITNDADLLIKIQIDNILNLGWARKDIWLFTNFPYHYNGVKARVLPNVKFFDRKPQASKINAIVKLFEKGIIKNNELYWFHDLDAFQSHPINEREINLSRHDMALTDYGRSERWSTGSIFFKLSSQDIFRWIKQIVYKANIDEERALTLLTKHKVSVNQRVKKINKTYNFTAPNIRTCYKLAEKPIRVVHFHPLTGVAKLSIRNSFDFFAGNNKISTPLMSDRLIKIFNRHNIRCTTC